MNYRPCSSATRGSVLLIHTQIGALKTLEQGALWIISSWQGWRTHGVAGLCERRTSKARSNPKSSRVAIQRDVQGEWDTLSHVPKNSHSVLDRRLEFQVNDWAAQLRSSLKASKSISSACPSREHPLRSLCLFSASSVYPANP